MTGLKAYVLLWSYRDNSASGLVGVFTSHAQAEHVQTLLVQFGDPSKAFRLLEAPLV